VSNTVEVGRADAAAASPATPTPESRMELRRDLIAAAIVAGVSIVAVVLVLQLWRADLRVPFVYDTPPGDPLVFSSDAPFYLMVVEGLVRHGSYLVNPSLAAPFEQELYDLVHGADNLQFGVLWAMGKVFRDAALVVNLYFLATFVAVSVTAFFVYRRLGVSRWTAAVIGVLYSFLPYHFARGTAHLLLAAYFAIPLAGLLILRVMSDDPPFTAATDGGRWKVQLVSKSSLWWLVGCAVIASTGAYYAIMPVIVLALVVVVDFVARRSWRTVVSGAIASALVAVVLLINISPTLLYWARHGSNDVVSSRGPSETEVNGLKVSQLLLPVEGHRIDAFADLQEKSTKFSVLFGERGQGLGIIGAFGFLALLGLLLAATLTRRRGPPSERRAILFRSGVITVIAILCGVVSGLSLLFAGAGLTQIRSWNRISILIAFFAFLAVGYALDWLLRRLPQVQWRRGLAGGVLGLVLVVGLFDQVSAKGLPDYDELARHWDEDAEYFDMIADELGPGASVFQYPWIKFPEAGIVAASGPYDQAKGFIHAPELYWSWGGVEGRPEDWTEPISAARIKKMVTGVTAAGFEGLLIDRKALAYGPLAVEAKLTKILGEEPQISPDDRYSFYDLRPYRAQLETEYTPEELEALADQALTGEGLP
jgi:phosphoglycerol transferase